MGRKDIPKKRMAYCTIKGLACRKVGGGICAIDETGQCSEEKKLLAREVEISCAEA